MPNNGLILAAILTCIYSCVEFDEIAPFDQRKVIGGVPPLIIFTVADPSLPPKHVTESDSVVNINSSGS